jgi:carbon-monoxide dehydrogenase medium subunit
MSFAFHRPSSAAQAVMLAQQLGQSARFIAGGTDLIIQINRRQATAEHVIDLSRLHEMKSIDETSEKIVIGALATHKSVESHPVFRGALTAFIEAARVVGGHQVRNIATIGGNVANASPAADLLPPLLAFDAELELLSPRGVRSMRLEHFLVGPRRTKCQSDELIKAVSILKPPAVTASAFLKAGRRKAMEISVVSVAARLSLDPITGQCRNVGIAIGAAAPTAIRAKDAEQVLEGSQPEYASFQEAGRRAAAAVMPITDVRASAKYREVLVSVLVPRALQRCLERLEKAAR